MGSICWTYDSGSGGTEYIDFIRCVYVREPQLHKMWCLGLDNGTHEIRTTEQVDVSTGTVGEFTNNYLAENGHRIPIARQIYINVSVQFLGIPNFQKQWIFVY